jgi:hypothetical protein
LDRLFRITIDNWFNAHPGCVIDRTQAVVEGGSLQGMNVWYHLDHRANPVKPERPQEPVALPFEVNGQVYQQVPKEHIEAVIEEAIQIWRSNQDSHGTLAVINPQRIVVILDRYANRGAVLPLDLVYPALHQSTRSGIDRWLNAPPTRRHLVLIDGSWFWPRSDYDQSSRFVEPSFMRTNMTYDPGPRPQNRPDLS